VIGSGVPNGNRPLNFSQDSGANLMLPGLARSNIWVLLLNPFLTFARYLLDYHSEFVRASKGSRSAYGVGRVAFLPPARQSAELPSHYRILRDPICDRSWQLSVFGRRHSWSDRTLDTPTSTDFVSFYAAGSLADAGMPELAYNQAAHNAAEERATATGVEYRFFYYPPIFLLLCTLFAHLPYLVAFLVFETATLAVYLIVVRGILDDRSFTALVPVLAFPAVFWTLGLGQNAFLAGY